MSIKISGSTGISGLDGSATTPVLQGASANSGIYYSGNTVFVSTSGTNAMTIGPTGNVAFANSSVSIDGQSISPFGGKNKIINGNHKVDQRNSYASVNFQNGYTYPCDRWRMFKDSTTVANGTLQVVSDAPTGFANSVKVTITTSQTSPTGSSNLISMLEQSIEGHNISDLNWGTADASPVTLSFWVKSSVTGTYTVTLNRFDTDYTYPTTYSVSSSNIWEYKTITIPGPTVGSWGSTNGPGVYVIYNMFCSAANTTSSSNAWVQGRYFSVSGSTNLAATNGATWQIAGVQLEKGSTATPFEFRQYGQELALCLRYYWKSAGQIGGGFTSGNCCSYHRFPVPMRASPTVSISRFNTRGFDAFYTYSTGSSPANVTTFNPVNFVGGVDVDQYGMGVQWYASGGQSRSDGYINWAQDSNLIFSVEL